MVNRISSLSSPFLPAESYKLPALSSCASARFTTNRERPTANGPSPSLASRAFPCTLEIGASSPQQTVMPTRPGFHIATIAGIPIYVHPTWLVIFGLITWTIVDQFSAQHPHWTAQQHWTVGIATSILFFCSVLFHELSHSVVAQHYKIRVVSITLFIFGGLARIEREPSKAIQEFNIAVAGPLASFFLGGAFWGIGRFFPYSEMIGALASFLSYINFALGLFNLLPGFPLDGGRILRAIVWGFNKDFSKATRVAGTAGKVVAYGMILFGAWQAFHNELRAGLWTAFIGWFILNAAQESVAQIAVRENLSGLRAQDVMNHEVPTFPGGNTLEDYAAEVQRTGRRFHLVLTDDRLTGMMNVQALNAVPREEWASTSVQGVMVPRENILWARPDEPLLGLLERLLTNDVNQMPVVSDGDENNLQIVGMVTRDSILRVIQTRSELGAEALGAK
jgi:Zn-dependent protease/CBS domain-containing protein